MFDSPVSSHGYRKRSFQVLPIAMFFRGVQNALPAAEASPQDVNELRQEVMDEATSLQGL